jgi:uncharacterized protein YgiM (DUF1202 family)
MIFDLYLSFLLKDKVITPEEKKEIRIILNLLNLESIEETHPYIYQEGETVLGFNLIHRMKRYWPITVLLILLLVVGIIYSIGTLASNMTKIENTSSLGLQKKHTGTDKNNFKFNNIEKKQKNLDTEKVIVNEGIENINIPTQTTNNIDLVMNLLNKWSYGNNQKKLDLLSHVYSDDVVYYGSKLSKQKVISDKQRFFAKYPNYSQIEKNLNVSQGDNSIYKITFDKYVNIGPDTEKKMYPSYLVIDLSGNPRIIEEGDKVTDKYLNRLPSYGSADEGTKTSEETHCTYYIVKAIQLNVREKPNRDGKIIDKVKKNEQVCVKKVVNGWANINKGWVSSKYLTLKEEIGKKSNMKTIHFSENGIDIIVSYHSVVKKGDRFILDVVMKNNNMNALMGGLTLSFPDIHTLSGVGLHNTFDKLNAYPPSSQLYSQTTKGKITSDYFVIEGWQNKWPYKVSKSFSVELIAPTDITNLRVNVRGVIRVNKKRDIIIPTYSNYVDQQGYYTKQFNIKIH